MFLVYIGLCFVECGCAEEIQPESIEEEKKMKTTIAKGCLYCGLRLPEQADFCPECGRPVEVVIRFESEAKKMRTTFTKGCLYCGLRLPDMQIFAPNVGGRLKEAVYLMQLRSQILTVLMRRSWEKTIL